MTPDQLKGLTAADLAQLPDFANWSDEQTGFAPYWKPAPGKWFYGVLEAQDRRDPNFVRYLVKALMPVPCHRGEVEKAEDVLVKPGEMFTCSVYYSLEELFNFYLTTQMEKGIALPVRVEALKTVKTKSNQDCWQFRVSVSPETRKQIESKRTEIRMLEDKARKADQDERKAIAEQASA